MKTLELKEFEKNIDKILKNSLETEEPFMVKTDKGNVVVLSEQQFDGMIEMMCRK